MSNFGKWKLKYECHKSDYMENNKFKKIKNDKI